MVEFSWLFSLFEFYYEYNNNHNDNFGVNLDFKFIKYDKFIRIKYGDANGYKSIIIRIENLKKNKLLFQYYITSLLYTINYTDINNDNNYYVFSASSTIDYWIIHCIVFNIRKKEFNEIYHSQEPKRESSIKKQKKFLKMLNRHIKIGILENPLIILEKIIELYLDFIKELKYQIIDYENKIYFLSCVRGFNIDIYTTFKEIFKNDNDNDNDKKLILPSIISNIK
jgi:hypothetical protein